MPKAVNPPEQLRAAIKDALTSTSYRELSARTGVHHSTLAKVARGRAVSPSTLEALQSLAASKTKTRDDYDSLAQYVRRPKRTRTPVGWPLSKVREARDAQLAGNFRVSAKLAEVMLLDDALYTAYHNRIAPLNALGIALEANGGVRGNPIRKAALQQVSTPRAVLAGIGGTLAMHGVAFGYLYHETDDEGTTVAFRLTEWPIEHVRWDDKLEQYVTLVDGQREEQPIVHGDGRWVIFAKSGAADAYKREACLLPSALIFSAHLDAMRDWAAASRSHGQAKIVGQLQEGVPVKSAAGGLSPDAEYFLDVLADLVSGDAGAGLIPAGASTTFLANGSSAWQVFSELALNREKAAARVFLGNDGTLGSVGGAPGVDIATLFGVATTKVQADVQAIQDALHSGVYVPWTAINFGDSKHAPRLVYQMPDADSKLQAQERKEARLAFIEAVEKYRGAGFEVTQDVINRLAAEYAVDPPKLASQEQATVSITLAPADVAKVVRVREARASQGLPPFNDERDDWTLTELEAKTAAASSGNAAASTQSPQPAAE